MPELGKAVFAGWGRCCCPRRDERGGQVRAGSPWAWLHTNMSETPAKRLLAEVAGLGQSHGVPTRLTKWGPGIASRGALNAAQRDKVSVAAGLPVFTQRSPG